MLFVWILEGKYVAISRLKLKANTVEVADYDEFWMNLGLIAPNCVIFCAYFKSTMFLYLEFFIGVLTKLCLYMLSL